jgi:hypothetical protein
MMWSILCLVPSIAEAQKASLRSRRLALLAWLLRFPMLG